MSSPPITQVMAPAAAPVAAVPPTTAEKATQPAPTVISQPSNPTAAMASGHAGTEEWKQDIFCPSIKDLCGAYWCTPCSFGKVMSRYDGYPTATQDADCCTPWCGLFLFHPWLTLWWARHEQRKKFGIRGSGFEDCMYTYWCPCLVLPQMNQELRIRAGQYSQPRDGMVYG